jgi:Fe2+ transport system protein FeoA
MEAGFVPEACVTLIHYGPIGGPRVYLVDGAEIAIRREFAASIEVARL